MARRWAQVCSLYAQNAEASRQHRSQVWPKWCSLECGVYSTHSPLSYFFLHILYTSYPLLMFRNWFMAAANKNVRKRESAYEILKLTVPKLILLHVCVIIYFTPAFGRGYPVEEGKLMQQWSQSESNHFYCRINI